MLDKLRNISRAAAALALLSLVVVGVNAPAQAETTTFRMVPSSSLQILDPLYTSSYVTRNFGYMVWDTLFAMDSDGQPQPQMAQSYKVSDDGTTWTFTLRPGLKFSDGSAVTSADIIASLKRWQQVDPIGQAIVDAGGAWKALSDRKFELTLDSSFAMVLEGLARVSSFPAFIMPAEIASTPVTERISKVVGSGPYVFQKDEWVHGSKVVFERNPYYKTLDAKPDGLSGDKTPYFDRVVWRSFPDNNSAFAALKSGEVDMIEDAPPSFIPAIQSSASLAVGQLSEQQQYLVFNQEQAPFNNAKARQAVAHVIDQNVITKAMGFPDSLREKYCPSFFVCGTAYATDAGAAPYKGTNYELAKQLLNESGYDGEEVIVLLPTDSPSAKAATLVAVAAMEKVGFNIKLESMTWGTLTSRRAKKKGWDIFSSNASVYDVGSPVNSAYIASSCDNSLPGWPCNEKLHKLATEWLYAATPEEQQKLLDAVQKQAYKRLPYLPIGQFSSAFAISKDIKNADKLWGVPNVWVLAK